MILTKKSRRFFYTVFREVKTLEIYLDLVFLENFLMDFILLLMVGKLIHKTICPPRLLAAAFLGGISAAVLCLLHPQFVLLQVCNLIAGLCMLHLSDKDNEMVTSLLNTVSDMERVGDHAENLAEAAQYLKEHKSEAKRS